MKRGRIPHRTSSNYIKETKPNRAARALFQAISAASVLAAVQHASAQPAQLYWDPNGTAAGAATASSFAAGTWNASNANWTTSQPGTATPTTWTAGGVATFSAGANATGAFAVTVAGTQVFTGLNTANGAVTLAAGASGVLSYAPTDDTIWSTATALTINVPIVEDPSATATDSLINFFGAGTTTGAVTLGGSNSFTNSIKVGAGGLTITNSNALGDNTGTTLVQSSSTVNVAMTFSGGINSPENIFLSGGTLNGSAASNIASGNITLRNGFVPDGISPASGGTLTLTGLLLDGSQPQFFKTGAGTVVLTGTSSYGGNLVINNGNFVVTGTGSIANNISLINIAGTLTAAGTLAVNGTGKIAATNNTGITIGIQANETTFSAGVSTPLLATFTLDKSGTLSTDNIDDSSTITLGGGGVFNLIGNASASSETMGNLNILGGQDGKFVGNNFVNATGGAGLMTLTANSLVRGAGGLAVFRGPNLGGTSGANAVQIKFSNTPTMLGGGGGNGTPTISIIPGVLTDNVITTNGFFSNINTSAGLGSGFATYDATVGLRALISNEYSSSFATNNNVLITAPANISSSTTINSLILNGPGAGVTIAGGNTLGVTSGMIMAGTPSTGNAGISGGAIDFQGNEAIVVNRTAMTISSNLGNANGFTKQGLGTLTLTGSGANLHGNTYLEEGATVITSGDGLGDGRTSVAPGAALELSGGLTGISVNHTVAIGGYFNAVNGAAFGLPGSADIVNGNGSTGGNIGALESLSGNNTINANVELTGGGLTGDPLNNPGNNIGNNGLNSIGVAAGSSLTIGGAINATSGPGSFVKVGDGTLVLTHADSMPGVVRLWGGVINAQADQALGGSPSTAVNVGFVAFLLNSRSTIGFSNNVKYITKDRDFTQMSGNGAGTLGIIDNFGGANRYDNNLTTQIARIGAFDILQPTYIGSQAGTLTLNGIFNSGGNTTPRLLIKLGAGTIDLANNINFGGQTEIQNGGFILGSNGSGDAIGFGKFSTGGLDVSQPNWLSVFSSAALVIDDTGSPETVANLGAQRFGGGSGEKVFLMGSEFKLIGNSTGTDGFGLPSTGTNAFTIIGSTTLTVSQPTGGAQTILQLNHARPANGFTLLVRGASLGATPGTLDNEITDTVAPTLVGVGGTGSSIPIVPWAFGDNAETGGGSDLVTYGANGFRPLAASEYETSGLPGNDQNLNYKITSDQTPITDSGVNGIVVNNANLNLGNTTLTVKSGAVLMASGAGIGATSINGGTLAFGIAEGIIYTGAGHNTTISATITGISGLTKSGPAALTLTASNSFSGPVSLNGGTLIVDNDNELGNASNAVNMSSGVLQPTAAYTSTPRNFTLNSKSGGFDIEGAQTFTIAGTIASSATFTPLVKTGTGTLVLSPPTSNTWIGGTVIRGGTLRVASDSALGSNSTAAANNDTTANPGSAIPLQIDGGTLSFSDNTSLGQRAVFLGKSNGTISVDAGKTVTFDTPTGSLDSNIIAFFGPGELFKDGAGTFEIRGSTLTFNGGADIRNGTLKMDTANALLSNAGLLSRVVRVDGGTLLFNTANTATAGFVQLGNNGTLAALNSGTYGATALSGYPNVEPGANVTLSDVTAGGVFTIVTQMSNMDPSNVAGTTVNIRGAGTTYLLNQPYANFVASFNIDGSTLRLTNVDAALGVQTNPISFSAAGGSLEMRETTAHAFANPVTLNGNGTFIESTTSTTTFVGANNTFGALTVTANSTLTSTNINGAANGVTSGNVGLVFTSASLGGDLTVNVVNPTTGGIGSVAIGTTGGAGISEVGGIHSLTKAGAGNLTLLGSATYTGATNLQAGTLTMVGAPAWSPVLSGPGGAVLTGGRMIFDYTSNPASDPATTGQIQAILNQTAFAAHFASGQIRTSPAADNLHAIGWIDDVANKQVRVAYTFAGDANVDGKVNTSDFTLLSQNFNLQTGAVWAQGDFDYNGTVNVLDFNAIATNFGGSIPGAPVDGDVVALGALVPEPSAIAMLAIGAASLLRRRRR